ncbi:MAG: hypothetical protein HY835_01410 [Anaerolineae bacterium]|nr:hypothetical protein [Anaerolineae bacterium]
MPRPQKSHDLRLPDWGPYTKRYTGISHIPDVRQGLRFDVGIVPGFYRRQMVVPNAKWESGHHTWEASADLGYFSYRFELEWKDQVYCDVSFSAVSSQARLMRCEFNNRTALHQNLMLHLLAYMNFPPVEPYSDEPVRMAKAVLPEGARWFDALDYEELQFAVPRPTDSLSQDGMLRAEVRAHGLVDGSGIGCGGGRDAGDWVRFGFSLGQSLRQAVVLFRYRLEGGGSARFVVDGPVRAEVTWEGDAPDAAGFSTFALPCGALAAGEYSLLLTSLGGAAVQLDGFSVLETQRASEAQFSLYAWTHAPEIIPGPQPNSLMLRYPDVDGMYGIAWNHPDFVIRQILNNEVDTYLRWLVPNNYSFVIEGPGEGHFTDIFLRPVPLTPQSQKVLYGLVCSGSRAEVEDQLVRFARQNDAEREDLYTAARGRVVALDCLPSGETYRFSQERMAATELLNVVYPVYTRRQFIRHNTPGKWWDCLYTWDSGFIGLALLELDQQRAVDCLNAYVTDPGDTHAAFVYHGSPVPTQIYLFHELWNRTQDRTLLEYFYPRLRQYYLFLAGRLGSSTTRALKSNLLRTWEYFEDSGGWDDYPAQLLVLETGIAPRVTCAAITAHVIRSARILLAAAQALGIPDDQADYAQDIALLSDALQRHAWDDQAGTFSYVVHDESGQPLEPLRCASGENFNLGLDGIMPLIAGVCNPQQENLLMQRLADPQHYWTRIGLSTVDQTAPYYRKDGYWNGAVWMPHQWFIWKTALDMGRGDFAHQIAHTALDLWKREVETTYFCYEHFLIQSGRGAGWHQFSGLSSPVVSWFGAYHRPGRLTTGMNVWVEQQQFSANNRAFQGRLRLSGDPREAQVLLTLQPNGQYLARWNGQVVPHREIHPGCYEVTLPMSDQPGILEFRASQP